MEASNFQFLICCYAWTVKDNLDSWGCNDQLFGPASEKETSDGDDDGEAANEPI